jgi:hypothetical protein
LEDVKPGTYRLIMAPRRVFTDKEHESSLQSLGLTKAACIPTCFGTVECWDECWTCHSTSIGIHQH